MGTVEVSGLTDNVMVQAGAGDVTVRDVAGGVNVEAPQSDISVGVSTDTRGEVKIATGDVDVQDMVVGTLEASVGARDVTLWWRFSGGRVSVETGGIVARLPSENIRDLTLETGVSEGLREPPAGSPDGGHPEGGT